MSKKITFILYNIDINDIDKKYNVHIQSNINSVNCSKNRTDLNELQYNNTITYSYIDEAKKSRKCCVTMCNNIGDNLPEKIDISCYWCRYKFSSRPIGCPIKKEGDNYIVDGVFCSFNCVLAQINSTSNYIYNDSYRLLCNLYKDIFEIEISDEFQQAPDWRLLKEYGGTKTIDQFRDNFNRVEYKNLNNFIMELPKQLPIGWLYEEKLSF